MKHYHRFILFGLIFLNACDSKPKVIVADEAAENVSNMDIQPTTEGKSNMPITMGQTDVHQVVADDILQSTKYTYLHVTEAGKKFWIATSKTEAKKGQTYMYKGGLMKTNFESVEFKRTFDTIYLVSHVISAMEHPGGQLSGVSSPPVLAEGDKTTTTLDVKDAVKLSDLMANKSKYDGKTITISGECVKANNGIMGRNWLHIQDGSKEKGKLIDLTVTTNIKLAVGSTAVLKGKITLNKDFGSGYRYDVLMEEAIRL